MTKILKESQFGEQDFGLDKGSFHFSNWSTSCPGEPVNDLQSVVFTVSEGEAMKFGEQGKQLRILAHTIRNTEVKTGELEILIHNWARVLERVALEMTLVQSDVENGTGPGADRMTRDKFGQDHE